MKLFSRSRTPVAEPRPTVQRQQPIAVQKPPVLEGWSEADLVSVYNAAPLKHLRMGDPLLTGAEQTDSFIVMLDGAIQVVVKWEKQMGRPGIVRRGDCVAPLPKAPGLLYYAEATEQCTVIEITPTVMKYLPAHTQVAIYRAAVTATSRINAYIRSVNGEITNKNVALASYVTTQRDRLNAAVQTPKIQNFLKNIPGLPVHAMDLAVKLLQETTSVQEIAEAIKNDPATASLVLRTVNSAMYGFEKKIETFYHACIILGFNNIYTLVMREAVQNALPLNDRTRKIHAHSSLISTLTFEIAKISKNVQAQSLTTAALLHDMGRCVQIMMKQARWLSDEHVDLLPPAKLGADLLNSWKLPERLGIIVENQHLPEYMHPDQVPTDFRREVGVLHLAHCVESILMGEQPKPELNVYTKDYMNALGLSFATPAALLKESVLPSLGKNLQRLPREIQKVVAASTGRSVSQN